MTPNNKNTVGCWLVLDDKGDTWRVQCLACNRKESFSRYLLGAVAPRCKCGGKVPSKPVEASKPASPAVVPVQVVAPVLTPVAKLVKPKPEPKPKAVREPKPPKPPKEPKPSRKREGPVLEAGQVIHGLTVLGDAPTFAGRAMTTCRCECGVVRDFLKWHVAKGNIQSCGCRKDRAAALKHNERTVALPGDVFGSLTVVEEAERNKGLRCVLTECRHCGMMWKVQVTNLRRTGDHCACESRLRQSSAGRLRRQERLRDIEAKRQRYRHLTQLRQIENQIRYHQDRIATLQARRETLQSAPTVAPLANAPRPAG
jgi:hypothetical protein